MRAFLIRLAIFFTPLIGLVFLYEALLTSITTSFTVKRDLIEQNLDSIELVAIGTSKIFSGVNPNYMDYFAINLANNSQSTYYDIKLLEKYIDKLPKLKVIVMEVNFFSFEYNLDNGPESWRNTYYSHTFQIDPQSQKLDFYEKFLLHIYKPKDILLHINSKKEYNSYFDNKGWGKNEITESKPTKEYALKRYLHLRKNYMHENDLSLNIKLLDAFLEKLNQKNIKIVIVQMPVSPLLAKLIDSKIVEKNKRIINGLQLKTNNLVYVDYLNDSRFPNSSFIDSDHLNYSTANKFSSILNDTLLIFLSSAVTSLPNPDESTPLSSKTSLDNSFSIST